MLALMDVLALYKGAGAYLEGHFLLASGRHTATFLQSTTVLQHPEQAEEIGRGVAALFAEERPDFVIGPAMGGVVLAFTVAKALGCRALFAEKDGAGGMTVRGALTIRPGERFLAVEDVVTTGGSLIKATAAAEARGGVCLGVGLIIDRGQARFPKNVSVRSLARLEFGSYAKDDCPLCRRGLPLEKV
jgi:orotate phosphoribosyltransferase